MRNHSSGLHTSMVERWIGGYYGSQRNRSAVKQQMYVACSAGGRCVAAHLCVLVHVDSVYRQGFGFPRRVTALIIVLQSSVPTRNEHQNTGNNCSPKYIAQQLNVWREVDLHVLYVVRQKIFCGNLQRILQSCTESVEKTPNTPGQMTHPDVFPLPHPPQPSQGRSRHHHPPTDPPRTPVRSAPELQGSHVKVARSLDTHRAETVRAQGRPTPG